MISLRTLACSSATSRVASIAARGLSTQTSQAVEKLKSVLEGYRLSNYQQELPTRFKKEIVKAATSHDDFVGKDGVQRVLSNIGATQNVTQNDLDLIFAELGQGGEIRANRFLQMI